MIETADERRQREEQEAREAAAQSRTAEQGAPTGSEQTEAPEVVRVDTAITIGEQRFELRNMSAEDGERLYQALPPEYQAHADRIARVALEYERTVDVAVPPGYFEIVRSGAATLDGAANALIGEFARRVRATDNPIAQQADGAGQFIAGIAEGVGMPFRIFDAAVTSGREGMDALTYSEEEQRNARAFGAAYAAAMYQQAQGTGRENMPLIGNPFDDRPELLFTYPMQALSAGFNWALANIPFVNTIIAPAISAAFGCLGGIIESLTNGQGFPNLGEMWSTKFNEAKAGILENQGKSFREILEVEITNGERTTVSQIMNAAGNVAGIPTEGLSQIIEHGGTYVASNGEVHVVRPENGSISEPIAAPDGQGGTITRGSRVADAWKNVLPSAFDGEENGIQEWTAGITGAATTTLAAGVTLYVGRKVAPVVGRNVTHAVAKIPGTARIGSSFLRGYAEGHGGKLFWGQKELRTGLGRANSVQHHPKVNDALNRVTKLEFKQAQHLARASRLQHTVAVLEAQARTGERTTKIANQISRLNGMASAELAKAENFGKVRWFELHRRELNPLRWKWNDMMAPLSGRDRLTRARADLQQTLDNTLARTRGDARFTQVLDVNSGRTVIAQTHGADGRALEEARLLTRGRVPALTAADSVAGTLARVQSLQTNARLAERLSSSVSGLRVSTASLNAPLVTAQRAQAEAARVAREVVEETARLSRMTSAAVGVADATRAAAHTATYIDDTARLVERAAEAARLQQLAANEARVLANAAAGTSDAARLAQVADESAVLARQAARSAEVARDVARVASTTVARNAAGVASLVDNAGAPISDLANVLNRSPEAARAMTVQVAEHLPARSLERATAATLQHIPTQSFGALSREALEHIPAEALAGASRAQLREFIRATNGDEARLAQLFTPERLAHVDPAIIRELPEALRAPAAAARAAATNFAAMDEAALRALPDSVLARASRQEWLEFARAANGDEARLAQLFTPERLQHIPLRTLGTEASIVQHIPESVLAALTPAQIEALPPRIAHEILEKHPRVTFANPGTADALRNRGSAARVMEADADAARQTAASVDEAVDGTKASINEGAHASAERAELRRAGLSGSEARGASTAHAADDAVRETARMAETTVHLAAEGAHGGGLLGALGHFGGRAVGFVSKIPGVRFVPIAGQVLMVGAAGVIGYEITQLTMRAREDGLNAEEMAQISAVNSLAMASCADPTVVASEAALYAARNALPAHLREYCVSSLGEMVRPLDGAEQGGAEAPAAAAAAQIDPGVALAAQQAEAAAARARAQVEAQKLDAAFERIAFARNITTHGSREDGDRVRYAGESREDAPNLRADAVNLANVSTDVVRRDYA